MNERAQALLVETVKLLAVAVIVLGAYHWRDYQAEKIRFQRDAAAEALAKGAKATPENNAFLAAIGRPDLAKPLPTPKPEKKDPEPVPSAIAGK